MVGDPRANMRSRRRLRPSRLRPAGDASLVVGRVPAEAPANGT